MPNSPEPASSFTVDANRAVLDALAFENTQDMEDIKRGFIAPVPNNGVIVNAAGETIIDLRRFGYIDGDAPKTANPSLWRQSSLIRHAGLFEVIPDGIYQVRSHDLAT
jgi:alkyl sulfatase BDS1-like metallo-beta-lactamase superfamily hydrolase